MLTLEAKKRDVLGKKAFKALAPSRLIPAVVYGKKEKSTPISISVAEFKKVYKEAGESSVVGLNLEGVNFETLIHAVDFDPLTSEPRHADFYALEKGQKVEVAIPLHFEGVSLAVKNLGGVLLKVLHELEVEASPKDLPHSIMVDISMLETLESQILVKDLKIPSGVEVKADGEDVVAAISVIEEEKEEVVPIDLSTIEVEKKGKKEEEGASSDSSEERKE
ncbi:MAG: 50S ribosomal protein L25 [Patescibacteria group bacterium]